MGTGGTSGSGSDKTKGAMNIEGYPVKGLSIAGHETCVMFPTLKLAFDIGRFPQQAISHDFLCISHAHMDHIVSPFCAFFTVSSFFGCSWKLEPYRLRFILMSTLLIWGLLNFCFDVFGAFYFVLWTSDNLEWLDSKYYVRIDIICVFFLVILGPHCK